MGTVRNSPPQTNAQRDAAAQPAKAYRLLYSVLLVVTYLAMMVDLFLIVITHGPEAALKVAFGLLLVCIALSFVPFLLFVQKSRSKHSDADWKTLWNLYSWQPAKKSERIMTAVIFAFVMIALGLIVSRGIR